MNYPVSPASNFGLGFRQYLLKPKRFTESNFCKHCLKANTIMALRFNDI
jgi:hypothetical protein